MLTTAATETLFADSPVKNNNNVIKQRKYNKRLKYQQVALRKPHGNIPASILKEYNYIVLMAVCKKNNDFSLFRGH